MSLIQQDKERKKGAQLDIDLGIKGVYTPLLIPRSRTFEPPLVPQTGKLPKGFETLVLMEVFQVRDVRVSPTTSLGSTPEMVSAGIWIADLKLIVASLRRR
jgi:hypothetical protein